MRSRVSTSLLVEAHARAVRSDVDDRYRRDPGGLRRVGRARVVGRGRAQFVEAARALLALRVHRSAGIDVYPRDATVTGGLVVVLGLGYGRVAVRAPCRVLRCWDGPASAGFTYAALDGHPESGWEEFSVTLDEHDVVTFRVEAESVPAWAPLRYIARAQNLVQDRIITAYLSAMSGVVASSGP